jgi:RHS repeat-associated protein
MATRTSTLSLVRDAAGQPTFVQRPDGETLTLAYDPEGNVVRQTDSRGRQTRLRYAGMGQLVEHHDPTGHRVRLRYDEELDLVAVENQAGDLHTFTLDRCGRVTQEKTFSGTQRKFLHDKAGRTLQVSSGAYRLTKLQRDPLGRIVRQISQGGNPHVLAQPTEETFTYDELGALLSARTPSSDILLERDPLGRIVQERETLHASTSTVSVTSRYDPAGQRVERTTSLAHKTHYAWNAAGELTGVRADWDLGALVGPLRALPQATLGSFDIKIARDPLGQELARRLPGGVVSRWDRDPFGRATQHRVLTGASAQSPGTDVARRSYAWASPEEISQIATLDPASGVVRAQSQYEYDPRGHLIRQLFSSGEVLERHSDPAGNLFRTRDRSDRQYGPGGVLRRANGTDYEVDPDGFLIKKTLSDGAVWKYTWDAHGQLTEVLRPDKKTVAFTYDAFGRRTTKTFDGATTEYVWDGDDLVHERVRGSDGTVAPLTTWVFEPGTFAPLAKIEGRKRYGVVSDHLGTPTMLATEAGKIAWRAQLDVYGVPREEVGVAEAEQTTNPWRFPGQYEDVETGLYYNRFRYYDPELGRYLSEDPIGLLGGQALFGYVTNSILWIDPHGLTGAYIFEFDTGEIYVGKGPENRFQTSQRKRSRQLPDSTIAKKAHLDFGSDKMGLMVEAELMRRHGFGLPDTKLINAITSPGEALLAAASAAERRKARDLANKLEKKAGIGCK